MVRTVSDRSPHEEEELLALAGSLAGGVARELARPIRELREMLAVVVDALDTHVANAKGPTPYSWKQVGELRDRVADAYLISRNVARLAGDLSAAIGETRDDSPSVVDVNKTIEAALNLARHRLATDTEVFIDFGAIPSIRAVPDVLLLTIARIIVVAAERIGDARDGEISLRSRRHGDVVGIHVTDNAPGDAPSRAGRVSELQRLAALSGATVEGRALDDGGTEICLRIPVRP